MSLPPPGPDRARARFWNTASFTAPIAVLAAALLGVSLAGGYDHFQWVGRTVTPLEAFGVLGPMLLPVAAYFFARQKYQQAMAEVSRSWPVVRGTVQTSEVLDRQTRSGRLYRLALTYAYEIAGVRYTSDGLAFAPDYWGDVAEVRKLALKYPAGTSVDVHYDPQDPSFAVLETTAEYAGQRTAAIWVLVIVPLIASLVVFLRQ
jgi:Protein of unknown function (DUF3592)